jgi:F-box and leucine-rich repeat protein GRR1
MQITDGPIGLLVQNAKYLLELDLTNCIDITGSFLPDMRCLNRDSFDSLTPPRFLPLLRELRLGGCKALFTDVLVARFAQQDWPQLRILDLTQCISLTDSDLITLVSNAPRLRNVILYKCSSLTDRGIVSLVSLGKYLHYLHLGHCLEITDRGVTELARHCTRLRYLDLASCVRITDAACIEIGNSLEKLKRIGLVKCINITDAGIVSLVCGRAQICNVLERIHLSYCTRLTLTVRPPLKPAN